MTDDVPVVAATRSSVYLSVSLCMCACACACVYVYVCMCVPSSRLLTHIESQYLNAVLVVAFGIWCLVVAVVVVVVVVVVVMLTLR